MRTLDKFCVALKHQLSDLLGVFDRVPDAKGVGLQSSQIWGVERFQVGGGASSNEFQGGQIRKVGRAVKSVRWLAVCNYKLCGRLGQRNFVIAGVEDGAASGRRILKFVGQKLKAVLSGHLARQKPTIR